jgi:hypothetical protein
MKVSGMTGEHTCSASESPLTGGIQSRGRSVSHDQRYTRLEVKVMNGMCARDMVRVQVYVVPMRARMEYQSEIY